MKSLFFVACLFGLMACGPLPPFHGSDQNDAASLFPGLEREVINTAQSEEREGGLIGTGRIAVIGVVSELGSIVVNGMRVQYDPDLMVDTAFGREPAALLTPGHQVSAIVTNQNGGWQAQSIERVTAIVAPVTDIDHYARSINVGGIDVSLANIGTNSGLPDPIAELAIGEWLAVSGIWDGDLVDATHLQTIAPRAHAMVTGSAIAVEAGDGAHWRIGSMLIDGLGAAAVRSDDRIAVRGMLSRANGTWRLLADRFAVHDIGSHFDAILVDGYVSRPDQLGHYTVFGTGVRALATSNDMRVGHRRIYCAKQNGAALSTNATAENRVTMMTAVELPDDPAETQAILTNLDQRFDQTLAHCFN